MNTRLPAQAAVQHLELELVILGVWSGYKNDPQRSTRSVAAAALSLLRGIGRIGRIGPRPRTARHCHCPLPGQYINVTIAAAALCGSALWPPIRRRTHPAADDDDAAAPPIDH